MSQQPHHHPQLLVLTPKEYRKHGHQLFVLVGDEPVRSQIYCKVTAALEKVIVAWTAISSNHNRFGIPTYLQNAELSMFEGLIKRLTKISMVLASSTDWRKIQPGHLRPLPGTHLQNQSRRFKVGSWPSSRTAR